MDRRDTTASPVSIAADKLGAAFVLSLECCLAHPHASWKLSARNLPFTHASKMSARVSKWFDVYFANLSNASVKSTSQFERQRLIIAMCFPGSFSVAAGP